MVARSDGQSVPREGLALPRFFAVILFTMAAIIGLPTLAAAIGTMVLGGWRPFAILTGVGLLVWMLVWLGRRLWTGRSIPRWFIAAFGLFIVSVAAIPLVRKGAWIEFLEILGLLGAFLVPIYSAQANGSKKPEVPGNFHEIM